MSRYIDADALKKRMLSVFEDDGIGVVLNGYWSSKLVREIIDEQPTADVEEVVRCKDCVHYQPSLFGKKNMCFRKDVDGVQICYDFSPNDYCSYGERREDDKERSD